VLFFYFISSDTVFSNNVKMMAKVKSRDAGRTEHKAILGHLSDYFGFKLTENASVLSVENFSCMTCHRAFAYLGPNTSLIYHL